VSQGPGLVLHSPSPPAPPRPALHQPRGLPPTAPSTAPAGFMRGFCAVAYRGDGTDWPSDQVQALMGVVCVEWCCVGKRDKQHGNIAAVQYSPAQRALGPQSTPFRRSPPTRHPHAPRTAQAAPEGALFARHLAGVLRELLEAHPATRDSPLVQQVRVWVVESVSDAFAAMGSDAFAALGAWSLGSWSAAAGG
jgi:hypothetical protein